MSRVALSVVLFLGVVLAIAAAAVAALIVVPAPSNQLAMAAILAGEKSFVIIAVAILASILAFIGSRPGAARGLAALAVLLSLAAIVLALSPAAQALRLASERRVDLDFARYLRSSIDTLGPIAAPKTVTYATVDGVKLGLDVYVASGSGSKGPSPAVLVAHGGGWSAGEKGDASLFSQMLAAHGYTVFDIQYRLAPQPNWKTATGDVKCAVGWVKQHASGPDWNIDPKRLTLLGRSAGGHLALLTAYTPGDPKLPPSCDAPDTTVESVIDFYGPADLAWGYDHPANLRAYDILGKLTGFTGGTPSTAGDLYRLLSPTSRATAAAPRTLIIHGGRDQLVAFHSSELLADRLRELGVPCDTLFIPFAQHGFDFIFGGFSEQIAEQVVLRFLAERPKPSEPSINDLPEERPSPDGGAK
jgi:acetyl esterase/lipase